MADNITITQGSGTTIATDDIGGVHYQKVILTDASGNTITPSSYAEDAAHASGDQLIPAGAVYRAAKTLGVGTDGDYANLSINASGDLRVDGGQVAFVDVTLSLDTSAYASGDLLADTQAVAGAVRFNAGGGVLHSVLLIDEDDQKQAIDLYFLSANNTFGTENSAPTISDANARDILGFLSIATSDYKDLGGVGVAFKSSVGMAIRGGTGSTSIWVAAVLTSGTPTYTASGIRLRLGFIQD